MELLLNILLISSCFLLIALAIRTWANLNIIGMPALFALIIFFMVWVVGNIIEANSTTFYWMLWGRNIEQIGVFFAPLCTLYFSIEYTANKKLRVFAYIISIIQAVSVFLIFTDQYYHIMRTSVHLQTNAVFGHAIVVQSTTIGSILVAFNFCIPLIALVILVYFTKTVSANLRRPLWLIIVSIFLTFILATVQTTYLGNIGINIPIPVLNLPCVALMTYAVTSGGFLGIEPTALSKVFEVIDQGIIVVDKAGRVMEYNRRALELMDDIAYCGCLQIGIVISAFMSDAPHSSGRNYFEIDELPHELTNSQRNKYISLACHVLTKSKSHVIGYVIVLTDITLLKVRAEIDSLTGIYNREGLTNAFSDFQKNYQSNPYISAIIIDLDNFKNINDTYGHLGGDVVLMDLVSTAHAQLLGKYALGRLGGDEFIVLISAEMQAAAVFAERLRKCVSERTVQYLDNKIKYTISVGVAVGAHDSSLSELMHNADMALYKAKQQGKNKISM
ncbi:MAG: diguanylate cyclase [Eubacteriaceae bacterium]